MATLTITVTSALGTSTKVLTFSAPDAQRILSAYQQVEPGGSQDQLVDWLTQQTKRLLFSTVANHETVTPTPPTFS